MRTKGLFSDVCLYRLFITMMAFFRRSRPQCIYACATCYYSYTLTSVFAAAPPMLAFFSHNNVRSYHRMKILSLRRNFSNEYKIEPTESYTPSDDDVESQTMNWIKRVVIGYNLCPFAEKPLRENKLNVSVVRGNDHKLVAAAVLLEMIYHSEKPGTTVVVAPEYYPDDFEQYMSLVQYLEDEVLEENEGLRGEVQIAPFHPLFQFEGSGSNGVDNYTNRSPYPMFHILREVEVAGAVQKLGGDASKVWERNVKFLEKMEFDLGIDAIKKAMRGETVDGIEDLLREIKMSES